MNNEYKYIIVKDKAGRIHHYKSGVLHHSQLSRAKGYITSDIIEAGVVLDKHIYILECIDNKHLLKHSKNYIGNILKIYQDLRLITWLRGRELESGLYYSKGILKEGD